MLIHENQTLKVHRLLLNDIKTNCYLIQKGDATLLIDPVNHAETILQYIHENQLKVKYMLCTHGHFDHVFAASELIEKGLVDTLYIHEKDFTEVKNSKTYSAFIYKKSLKIPKMSMFDEGLMAFLEELGLGIEHVGGHTKGSCYLYSVAKDFIITGDLNLHHKLKITLFDNRENYQEFYQFLETIKSNFDSKTIIFPGHGDMTTVGIEFEKNKKWIYVIEKQANIALKP